MGVVLTFPRRGNTKSETETSSQIGSSVTITTAKPLSNTPANDKPGMLELRSIIRKQVEGLFKAQGVDVKNLSVRSDLNIIVYLAQGIIDRSTGCPTEESLMLDTLSLALGYDKDLPPDDGSFDDLLSKL